MWLKAKQNIKSDKFESQLVGDKKPEGKRRLASPRNRWEQNIRNKNLKQTKKMGGFELDSIGSG